LSAGLRLFLRCHGALFALDTRTIERVVLSEDVRALARPSLRAPESAAQADLPPVRVGGTAYAAWDLARLLGLPEVGTAFVLLRGAGSRGSLPLALRTGPCVNVSGLSAVAVRLPEDLFHARTAALRAVFPIEVREGEGGSRVGYELALDDLWSPAELAFSEATLAALEPTA
jgi:hypothetical protein